MLIVPGHIAKARRVEAARKRVVEKYSEAKGPSDVLAAIRKIDTLLDLKVFLPTGKWHVVRYPHGRGPTKPFLRCITLEDDPDLGKQATPGMWLVEYLHKCDTHKRDMLTEVEKHESKWEQDRKNEVADIAQCIAEDLRKPLLADLDGIETNKTVYQVPGISAGGD